MSNVSDSSPKSKKEEWLQKCVENLNGTAYDAINGVAKLLSFSAPLTIVIPPIPDYNKVMKKNKIPFLGPSSSKVLENDKVKRAYTRGFQIENSVSQYFARFCPGGIYLSNLLILELIRGESKEAKRKHFLPDVKDVQEYLTKNADVEIDGILIHPKIGLAVIEIKSVEYSNDQNQLPREIFGERGVKKQLNRYEAFVKQLFYVIFGKEIPYPIYKIACAPNADTGQTKVSETIYLLDQNAFNENGENFQLFWDQLMTLETEVPNREFIQFAAVLITLKTAFGLVSTYTSNIISASHDFLNEQKLALYDTARKQSTQMKQQDKMIYFWLNCEQLNIYEYQAGKFFITGPPGSGKTLLLKARILKNRERKAQIYCPDSLTFQYEQFVHDNELQDKVEVQSFSVLMDMAKFHKKYEMEGMAFHESKYGYFLSPDIDIYCDEMNNSTFDAENIPQIFELRPDSKADTFIVGESPDVALDPIFQLSEEFERIQFLVTSLKIMMRSSIEITEYFLSLNTIAARNNIRAGHSMKFFNVLMISCKNKNEAIQEIITCIYNKREHYKYSDMAVITLKYQIDEIENALQRSNIATKHLKDNANENAITIVSPNESRSYEWKIIIVCMNFDLERELSLAVTRAKIELIIIKQKKVEHAALQKTVQETEKPIIHYQPSLELNGTDEQDKQQTEQKAAKQHIGEPEHGYNDIQVNFGIKRKIQQEAQQFDRNVIRHIKIARQNFTPEEINLEFKVVKEQRFPQSDEEINKNTKIDEDTLNAEAQFNLGVMHETGEGVPQSDEEAVKWYKKAAEQGHIKAQSNLGTMYANGQGVQQCNEEAVKWYTKAAEQGHVKAQCNLGNMYADGQGVPPSDEEAVKWFTKVVEQNIQEGQYNLGIMYMNGKGVLQSDEVAVKLFTKAAEQGVAQAQFTLGIMHETGEGVPQSHEEAVKWYTKAAEQGHVKAQCNLGNMYADGQGVPPSDEEAVKWFTKAAEQETAIAQYNLGLMYLKGQGIPQSDEEAVKWFIKAAKQDHVGAQYNLGVMYDDGHGVPQSDEEAVKWYAKAAEHGHEKAKVNLGFMVMREQCIPQSNDEANKYYKIYGEILNGQAQFNLGFICDSGQGGPQSDKEAIECYTKAAEQGIAEAQLNLGRMYYNGQGLPQSDEEAAKWYRKAAEHGYVNAQYYLGLMYDKGEGILQSDQEAVKWYTKAAEQNYAEAQFNLGSMYHHGQGVPQSEEEAAKWYIKAAEQGYAEAQFNLGLMSSNGQGVPQSDEEAVKWYTKAAEQDHPDAQFNLAVMYHTGQGVPQAHEDAAKWYTRAAENGDALAQFNLALMYNIGQGVPQSDEESFKWLTKAAEQGDVNGQNFLGELYYYGRGVPQSDEEALKWYSKAVEQSDAHAQSNLGRMYMYGRGVPQSYEEALNWYRKAVELGNSQAQNNFGFMHQYGRGVSQSDDEAVKWYIKAAEDGNGDGQINLGFMYQNGRGVPKSDEEAAKWYRKAAEKGSADGENSLGLMYKHGRGIPQSDEEALKWYRKAAEQGGVFGQDKLDSFQSSE